MAAALSVQSKAQAVIPIGAGLCGIEAGETDAATPIFKTRCCRRNPADRCSEAEALCRCSYSPITDLETGRLPRLTT